MIRRPPSSTRAPDTTLFRSQSFWGRRVGRGANLLRRELLEPHREPPRAPAAGARLEDAGRSEEHTSELQSRHYLVCRLLLEKKNISNGTTRIKSLATAVRIA